MQAQHYIVLALLAFQAALAAIVAGSPNDLGLPHAVIGWAAVLNVVVGVLLNQLTAMGQKKSDSA